MMNAHTPLYACNGIVWEQHQNAQDTVALVIVNDRCASAEASRLAHQFAATPQLIGTILAMLRQLHTLRGCDAWCIKQYHWVFEIYDIT